MTPLNEKTHGKHHRYTMKPLYQRAKIHLSIDEKFDAILLLERVVAHPDPSSATTSRLQIAAANDLSEIDGRDGKSRRVMVLRKKICVLQGTASQEPILQSMLDSLAETITGWPMLVMMIPLSVTVIYIMLISWILNNVGDFGVILTNIFLFLVQITSMLYGTTK
jgi:hypothetical protein